MARGAIPRITWGASFANVLDIRDPVNVLNYPLPAEGSEFDSVPSSGEADAWLYGPDQIVEATIRWIPIHDTVQPSRASGWDGWQGAPDNLNLLGNGSFESALTDSWSAMTGYSRINTDPSPPHGAYVLEKTGVGAGFSGHRVAVNIGSTYDLRAMVKRVSTGSDALQYLGIACYDARGRNITPKAWYCPNGVAPDTTLALDVNPGDATVTLVDASGYPDESGSGFNTAVALNALPLGADMPNFEVLRYTSKSGNVLTLTEVVPAGVSALRGSATRFHRNSGNQIYNLLAGVAASTLSISWAEKTATLGPGERALGTAGFSGGAFAPGTRSVGIFVQGNGTEVIRYDDFRLTRTGTAGLGWRAFLDWARDMNVFRWYPDASHPAIYYPMYLVEPLMEPGVTLERGSRHRQLTLRMRTSDRSVVTGY